MMGLPWSSPYKWQITLLSVGFVALLAGLVFLLLSVGADGHTWKLLGGVCVAMGTIIMFIGTCWCAWATTHQNCQLDSLMAADAEIETLTNENADIIINDYDVS